MLHAKAQQPKIWMGLASVAAAVALIGCGGEDPGTGGTTPPSPQGQTAGQSGGTGGGMPVGGQGLPAATGLPGANQVPGAATQTVAATPGSDKPAPGFRKDPFRPWFNTTPPPPNVLTLTEPVRIAMVGTSEPDVQPGVEIQEVPNRRVAGILNGNGVYALLDGPGGAEVVKPGQLLDDGYRVVMINSNSVTLQKKINTQTYTQVVPLTDAGSTTAAPVGVPGGGGFRAGGPPGFGGPGFGGPGGGPSRAGGSAGGGGAASSGN